MKKINEVIHQINNSSDKPSTGPQLTTGDKDLVNWFFLRLETSYGRKFWTEFSDEKTVLLTKREWAGRILEYSRDDLHYAIEKMKVERENGNDDFKWPDIANILGLLNNRISPTGHNSAAYIEWKPEKLITDQTAIDKTEEAGKRELGAMKDLFK